MILPAENYVIAVSSIDPQEGDLRTEMFYDYMGRHIRKIIREWFMIVPPPASPYPEGTWGWGTAGVVDDMRYIYDGWKPDALHTYVWRSDLGFIRSRYLGHVN